MGLLFVDGTWITGLLSKRAIYGRRAERSDIAGSATTSVKRIVGILNRVATQGWKTSSRRAIGGREESQQSYYTDPLLCILLCFAESFLLGASQQQTPSHAAIKNRLSVSTTCRINLRIDCHKILVVASWTVESRDSCSTSS